MKPIIISLALILTTAVMMGRGQAPYLASGPGDLILEEEAYIDDIPFDTWLISKKAESANMILEMEEEAYVDDIPFDTELIAEQALLDQVMLTTDEPDVDDIPFNTEKIYNDVRMKEWTTRWQDEQNVDDIPYAFVMTCMYDPQNCVYMHCTGSAFYNAGTRGVSNIDFIIETRKYMDEFNDKLKDMENLSIKYPF